MPGDCLALSGSTGYLDIRLRRAVVPTAVTLEHIAATVAFDLASAPHEVKLVGWLAGRGLVPAAPTLVELGDIAFSLQGKPLQTFNLTQVCACPSSSLCGVVPRPSSCG
jgi:SUN domain-containing protein 1/2